MDITPLSISGGCVERVADFWFLGARIEEGLAWSTNTSELQKKAQQRLYFLRALRKNNVTQRLLVSFYKKALKRMKSGKAVGPDDIPVEVWKCLGEAAVEFLASLFNRVLESERMPEEWRRIVLVPIFKNKGHMQSFSNYTGIKLMSHTMKLWERVVEARLRKVVEICEQQYGFMPRKSTTDAIFALRILMEKYRDGQRELHCVFVDLEKAYDRVPRGELWYCMRKSGVAEKYVRMVQDMYERSRTVVRCAVGQTEAFNVEVGLHQGSALSPFLFAIVMDQLSEKVRQESPWTMMFADDIVICSESREQVEENLERWRFVLERRGMKVSRSKTEYMCVNEREGSGTVRLQGEEVKKVQEFKYLGSTVQSNGECGKEVKKQVQADWNGWRKVLCDRKISARIKGKVYRTVVRPAMLYGLETVSLRKRQESELEVAELKMLRFSLGVTRLDRIRNEYIRWTAHVGRLGDKVREDRLRWFGHVQRRESEYIGRRMLDMELPSRRQRGSPNRRYMDGINEDMKLVGASVEDAEDRDRQRLTQTNPVTKQIKVWTAQSEGILQDCFALTDWDVFKAAATWENSSVSLQDYAEYVTGYNSTSVDNIIHIIQVRKFPNQKPWINSQECHMLHARSFAFISGNDTEYKSAKYGLRKAITMAKRQYREKLESFYSNAYAGWMWQGLQHITVYRPTTSTTISSSDSLPDNLNTFYAHFETSSDNTE
ncbi:hypothetical protein QTP86_025544 [Hemibagrus guttatus]|nr:hypothetical protein QTP86_025544 [Hemibagrus guttatus]